MSDSIISILGFTILMLCFIITVALIVVYLIYGKGLKFKITVHIAIVGAISIIIARILGLVEYKSGLYYVVLIVAFFIAISTVFFSINAQVKNIITPIRSLSSQANSIIEGNLNVKMALLEQKDEFGDLSIILSKMVEKILHQMEYNETIINSMENPLLLIDQHELITGVNLALLEKTGFQKSDLIHEKLTRFFNFNDYRTMLNEPFTLIHSKNTSQRFYFRCTTTAIEQDGILSGYVIVFNDITNLQQLILTGQKTANDVSEMTNEMANGLSQINISNQEVITGNQEMAIGINSQAEDIQKIYHQIVKIQEISQKTVEKEKKLFSLSQSGVKLADTGEQSIKLTMNQMDQISSMSKKSNEVLEQLLSESSKIHQIVESIGNVATETNLLALNAAIEAARAGEAGKGFAVVADQVRKLAEDSKNATQQISEILEGIRMNIETAVSYSQKTQVSVEKGDQMVQDTQSQIVELNQVLVQTNTTVSENIQEIESEHNLIAGIQINIGNISLVIESNSATAEELSSSTEEMASSLQELQAEANELKSFAQILLENINSI